MYEALVRSVETHATEGAQNASWAPQVLVEEPWLSQQKGTWRPVCGAEGGVGLEVPRSC